MNNWEREVKVSTIGSIEGLLQVHNITTKTILKNSIPGEK